MVRNYSKKIDHHLLNSSSVFRRIKIVNCIEHVCGLGLAIPADDQESRAIDACLATISIKKEIINLLSNYYE